MTNEVLLLQARETLAEARAIRAAYPRAGAMRVLPLTDRARMDSFASVIAENCWGSMLYLHVAARLLRDGTVQWPDALDEMIASVSEWTR
jgi:hypothetical protein